MAQTDPKNLIPAEYEIIFQQLESEDVNEVDLMRRENDEINELRKIIAEISEPDILYATSSHGEPALASSIHISFCN
jgi:hypothetical protein